MARFSVAVSMDEVYSCRHIARSRGDTNPKAAIREQAVSLGLRRRWDGTFPRFEKWDCWKTLEIQPTGIEIREVQAMIADLELTAEDPLDSVFILLGSVNAPVFTFLGWTFGRWAKKPEYWRATTERFVFPHANLRYVGELRKRPRNASKRLHQNDPADDFAGKGPVPHMLDTDGGRHPKFYGNIITSNWALPCRRCQKIIPAGMAVGGNMRTGTIHGDPADCGFEIKAEVDPNSVRVTG
jgi:hypothetical protein